ncbi:hypothetical protein [Acidovorax sp. sic0104]|uniref:hypothetical protein n=1 Tax=Acidovorax sp. sic0104 TaxID=2854784 RepID=UPI001C48FD7B|nr:hypothetical protein [Acidovorax sp. sic0104]MBV7542221.1 hypothetical protein [Acidovorax sp. sic0104]
MAKLSTAQAKLVQQIRDGGRVFLDPSSGLFRLQRNGETTPIDQRPVDALRLQGVLTLDMSGLCRLAESPPTELAVEFRPDQEVRWAKVVRGKQVGLGDVTVVRASAKQVRIRTPQGFEHNVRPGALSALPGRRLFDASELLTKSRPGAPRGGMT